MNTDDLALFVRVVNNGSLSGAARELNISPALASAAIKRLEAQLGTALLIRSTRQLRLSNAGERFLPYAQQVSETLEQGLSQLSNNTDEFNGDLRIATSSDLGRNTLLPWLAEFQSRHPGVRFRLIVGDHLNDFYRDRIDIAIRYGEPEDSSDVAFKLCDVPTGLYASPDYLSRRGTPTSLTELRNHDCLVFHLAGQPYDHWTLQLGDSIETLAVNARFESNDSEIVRRWACAGKGIMIKSALDVRHDLAAGRLVQILPEVNFPPNSIWLVVPGRGVVTPSVLAMRDGLREYFKSEQSN